MKVQSGLVVGTLVLLASVLVAVPWSFAAAEVVSAGGGVQPQVAISPSGTVHVVFGRGDEIFHTSSRDAKTFTAPVKVGQLEKLALGRRRGPRIAATDKLLLVTAVSHKLGAVQVWTSADD